MAASERLWFLPNVDMRNKAFMMMTVEIHGVKKRLSGNERVYSVCLCKHIKVLSVIGREKQERERERERR